MEDINFQSTIEKQWLSELGKVAQNLEQIDPIKKRKLCCHFKMNKQVTENFFVPLQTSSGLSSLISGFLRLRGLSGNTEKLRSF